MAIEVKVPSVGESITSGILASWRVSDGDYVKRDQPIFDLETDKITSEGLASSNGRISLKVDEGEEVEIGQVVAEIDESADSSGDGSGSKKEQSESEKAGEKAPSAKEEKDPSEKETGHPLSPAARRAAEESNVDVSGIKGSGKDGRVTKNDVLEAVKKQQDEEGEPEKQEASREKESSGKPEAPRASEQGERTTRKKLSPMRRRIAERLVASQRETATLTTFNEVDLSTVKTMRARYQDRFVDKYGIKLGFMSFFIKASVHALKEVPAVNAQLDGDTLVQNHFHDISVAVSTDKGLLVPVIRDCDRLSYAEIEKRIADVAERAKEGKIQFDELEGGVFTITNGGIFGSMLSTPVINPPQSAILGMHAIQDRPVVVGGEVKIRPIMQLALSYDHRIIDGREAVTFLRNIKEALEDPARILLEL